MVLLVVGFFSMKVFYHTFTFTVKHPTHHAPEGMPLISPWLKPGVLRSGSDKFSLSFNSFSREFDGLECLGYNAA